MVEPHLAADVLLGEAVGFVHEGLAALLLAGLVLDAPRLLEFRFAACDVGVTMSWLALGLDADALTIGPVRRDRVGEVDQAIAEYAPDHGVSLGDCIGVGGVGVVPHSGQLALGGRPRRS